MSGFLSTVEGKTSFAISDESWNETYQLACKTIEYNSKVRAARDVAMMTLGGKTQDELNTKYETELLASFFDEPEFCDLVDSFTIREDIQEEAIQRQADRTLKAALSRIETNMGCPDVPHGFVKDGADLMLKITNQIEKCDRTLSRPTDRKLTFLLGTAEIITPEGKWGFRLEDADAVVRTISLLRCNNKAEVNTVINCIKQHAPSFYHGGITLKGW